MPCLWRKMGYESWDSFLYRGLSYGMFCILHGMSHGMDLKKEGV